MPVKSRTACALISELRFSSLGLQGAKHPMVGCGNKNNKKMARIAFSQFSSERYEYAKRARPSAGRA
jgi:hypothetical protein